MPYGWGTTGVFTSSSAGDLTAGRHYTRLKGPLLLGDIVGSTQAWPSPQVQPPHIANVSTSPADFIMNAGQTVTTATVTGYVYIPMTTVGFSASSGTVGPTPAPAILKGAAIVWDGNRKKISVYSTEAGDWLSTVALTSS